MKIETAATMDSASYDRWLAAIAAAALAAGDCPPTLLTRATADGPGPGDDDDDEEEDDDRSGGDVGNIDPDDDEGYDDEDDDDEEEPLQVRQSGRLARRRSRWHAVIVL